MNYRHSLSILAAGMAACLVNPTLAQMRPECGLNPDMPGVCFSPTDEVATIHCRAGGPGVLQIFNSEPKIAEFKQKLPNGLELVHVPRSTATFGFCYWEDIFSGNCFPPADGAFVGTGSFILQGFENEQGFGCPLRLQGSATLFRLSDGEMLDISLDAHAVPDTTSPSGCATRICQLVAPD